MACNDPNCAKCQLKKRLEADIMGTKSNKNNVRDLAMEIAKVIADHHYDFNMSMVDIGLALTIVMDAHAEHMAINALLNNIDLIVTGALDRSKKRGDKSVVGEA